jgi:quercetin dioxygenase-like cupin family protein
MRGFAAPSARAPAPDGADGFERPLIRPASQATFSRKGRRARLGVGLVVLTLAGAASAQPASLINEPVAIAPGFDAHMVVVNIPPAGDGPLTTAGQRGHRHPASTYAYVTKGAVISRLGDGPEKRFETGQAWSETPLQPHYIVNASRTEPAQLVVVQIAKAGTAALTEPMPLTKDAK